jgi:Glycosyl hydrolases family 16
MLTYFLRRLLWLAPLLLLTATGLAQKSQAVPPPSPARLSYRPWHVVFNEEFNYADLADLDARSDWEFYPDANRTLIGNELENQRYDPAGLAVQPGRLLLIAEPLRQPYELHFKTRTGQDTSKVLRFRSGWIMLNDDFWNKHRLGDSARWVGNRGFQYGLFEIRCKLAPAVGTWPAFWLYSGPTEIDVFEGSDEGHNEKRANSNNVHVNTPPKKANQATYRKDYGADLAQQFNTYSVVWTPTEVTFYLNRRWLRTVPASTIPTTAAGANIITNLAILSYADTTLWPGAAEGRAHAIMEVDYIRVYKPRDGSFHYGLYPAAPAKRRRPRSSDPSPFQPAVAQPN